MSIHNDYRKYGTEKEQAEWKSEMLAEYARQEAYDRECEERMMCEEEDEDEGEGINRT